MKYFNGKEKHMKRKMKNFLLSTFLAFAFMMFLGQGLQVQAAEKMSYQIRVNRAANCITVYELDANGEYTVPLRSFVCSTGKNVGDTPLGNYKTYGYHNWMIMVDKSWGQYAIRFNGGILFHSVPYYSHAKWDLETDQFNRLGEVASLGCVRLAVSDVKWLYENCAYGTSVIVYDDAENPGPLGKPQQMKLPEDHPFSVWDPTDPDERNPWHLIRPSMYLKRDMGDNVLYVPVGATKEDIYEAIGVKTYDNVELPVGSYDIYINGNYDLNTFGAYRVWVTGTDIYGITVQQEMTMAVVYM